MYAAYRASGPVRDSVPSCERGGVEHGGFGGIVPWQEHAASGSRPEVRCFFVPRVPGTQPDRDSRSETVSSHGLPDPGESVQSTASPGAVPRAADVARDRLYRTGGGLFSLVAPAALVTLAALLLTEGLPALRVMGFRFLTTAVWDPGVLPARFGVLSFLAGTMLTSAIALGIAVPVGVFMALFLTEWAPRRVEPLLSALVELLAGIPSVVYGLWGLAVVVPLAEHHLAPWLSVRFAWIPFLSEPVGTGMGLLSTGLVLAVMVVPFVAAGSRDAIRATPPSLREGALALGVTRWEASRDVALWHARGGIVGSAILGLGRALGETMVVLMLSGTALESAPVRLYAPVSTLASALVSELSQAVRNPGGMTAHALALMAFVLLLLSAAVNSVAHIVIRRGRVA